MERRKEEINLAALLDNELQDELQLEALSKLLESDPGLQAELDEQTQVKQLLGELEQYKAPDYMATRVLGEIAARRKAQQAAPRWRPAFAWFGGAMALLMGFVSSIAFMGPRLTQSAAPLLAEGSGRPAVSATYASSSDQGFMQPGMLMEVEYAAPVWEELPMPSGNTDERIEGFLRFASESHDYRRMQRSGGCATANLAEAVLVLNDQETPVHTAVME